MSKTIHEVLVNGEPLPFDLTEIDKQSLLMTDDEYVPDSWERVKELVNEDRLDEFRRYPSNLRRYIVWTIETKAKYGNMTNYLCLRRLMWRPREDATEGTHRSMFEYACPAPFADKSDYKILYNDWNYGVSPDIVHLVVWSKVPIDVTADTGAPTNASKKLIDDFVEHEIREPMRARNKGNDCVLWFKNWTKLQSMRSVEHFHLFVRNADPDLLAQWTNGDGKDMPISREDIGDAVWEVRRKGV